MSALYISAAHKSSGKTTVMLGICRALSRQGIAVRPFKKGPDYIDPAWLKRAAGRACYNLDFYTSSQAEIASLFQWKSSGLDLSLVEGNKGLYDGMDINGTDSNAALAKLLGTPVVLVIDTMGMTRGIAPLLIGYREFDPAVQIAGVILNRVGGPRHEAKLVESVAQYTDIPVIGAVPRFRDEIIEERHLGLIPAHEDTQSDRTLERLADVVAENVNLDQLLTIAASAKNDTGVALEQPESEPVAATPLRIGVARDEAFGFYYADDLERFRAAGAEIVWINMIEDDQLPQLDGLFIGGGFPETAMDKLSANKTMRRSVRLAIEAGLPCYAECGGLMYLAKSISWRGNRAEMVGVIPGSISMSSRPHGRGYIRLQETDSAPWPGGEHGKVIAGHEFHYSQLEGLPADTRFAYDVLRGAGIREGKDGFVYKNLLASYAHLRDSGQNHWVRRFLAFVEGNRRVNGKTATR